MKNNSIGGLIIVFIAACVIMPLCVVCLGEWKPSHSKASAEVGCACASTTAPSTKFLIFWKEKEGDKEPKVFKISDKLFDSVVDAWKTVPANAAEVRIITVRID
jgi:hypothetical protein